MTIGRAQVRQRGFGTKAAVRPVALPPSELHHSSGKLVLWTLIAVVFVALSVWIIASGGLGADYHGRDAGIVHLLGPQGTILLFAVFGLGCAVLGAAYLRLLLGADRLAARADTDGLRINGVWGARTYDWSDVRAIGLHVTVARSREVAFIKIQSLSRRDQLVPVTTVEGGRAAVEHWIAAVQMRPV